MGIHKFVFCGLPPSPPKPAQSPPSSPCRLGGGGGHRCGVTTAMAVAHRCDDCTGGCTFGEEGCNGSFHHMPYLTWSAKLTPSPRERKNMRLRFWAAAEERFAMHGSSLLACLLSADGAPRVPSERLFKSLRSAGSDDSVLKGTRELPSLHSKPELFIRTLATCTSVC